MPNDYSFDLFADLIYGAEGVDGNDMAVNPLSDWTALAGALVVAPVAVLVQEIEDRYGWD